MTILPPYKYDENFDVHSLKRDLRELNGIEHEEFLNENPQIGPHEGRFLQLILLGKKALCLNAYPNLVEQLKSYIDSGEILIKPDNLPDKALTYTVCRADHIHYIENANMAIAGIHEEKDINKKIKHHRDLGRLLGYPKKEIDFFCNQERLNHIKKQQESYQSEKPKDNFFQKIKNRLFS